MRIHINTSKLFASVQMNAGKAVYVAKMVLDRCVRPMLGTMHNGARFVKRGFGWYRISAKTIQELKRAVRLVVSTGNDYALSAWKTKQQLKLLAGKKVRLIAASFGDLIELTTVHYEPTTSTLRPHCV